MMRLVRSNPPNLSFVENLQKVSCCRCHGNSPPQADFFKILDAKMQFCKGNLTFQRSKISKKNRERFFGSLFFLMGTQNRSKTPYGKDFGWTPPTPGGGCNKPLPSYISYIANLCFNFLRSRKPYGVSYLPSTHTV